MKGVIVLGLDGACWPLLEPWLEAGELPNLTALREEATWGPLQSQLPPVTSPNWRCYATGRNPAKLGVFWWEIVDRKRHLVRHPTARDFHTRPLWDELASAGHRVTVLNFPTGYPPPSIPGGRFTAGGPGAKDTGFATPARWESELRRRYGYRVHPTEIPHSAEQVESQLDEILSLIQSRFDVAFDLLDEGVDFLHITIFYINVLHHFCYRGHPSKVAWQLIDRNLGQLRQRALEKGYNLLLMSDHGCAPVDAVFYVNTWLAQEGYLKVNLPATAKKLRKLGLYRERFINLARRWGLTPLLQRLIPERIQRALPGAGGTFDKEAKGERIDWHQSLAVASGQGLIYLLLPPEHPDYEPLREEIATKLAALRNPFTGQSVALRVFKREELYSGPFIRQAPDLIFEQGPGIHTSGGVGYPKIFEPPQKWVAENIREGLFLAWGPDFAPQGYIENICILDLAPTILHIMGVPVPDDMDGCVLTKLLATDSETAKHPVAFHSAKASDADTYEAEEEAELAARLKALGYLD